MTAPERRFVFVSVSDLLRRDIRSFVTAPERLVLCLIRRESIRDCSGEISFVTAPERLVLCLIRRDKFRDCSRETSFETAPERLVS